jgi:hypothetical protein
MAKRKHSTKKSDSTGSLVSVNPLIVERHRDMTICNVKAVLSFLSAVSDGLNNGFGISEEQAHGLSLVLDSCHSALEHCDSDLNHGGAV